MTSHILSLLVTFTPLFEERETVEVGKGRQKEKEDGSITPRSATVSGTKGPIPTRPFTEVEKMNCTGLESKG